MNKLTVNTFTEGINKDVDKSMLSNKTYLDARNFRMITTKGNSTGALETIKGNKLLHAADVIESGQFIIGAKEIRDKIIIFTTSNITTDPTTEINKKSQIYAITINLETEVQSTISLLYDDSLNTNNSKLYFSVAYPIKAIEKYETPNIQKIYWTDGYNNLRFANFADTATTKLTVNGGAYVNPTNKYMSIDKFEFLPNFVSTKPILKNIVGGTLNTGMVAYAYQLYINNGSETAFSAISDPIHIVLDSDFSTNTLSYQGNEESINSGKGCVIKIVNTNVGYNRLRLIRIEYSTYNGIPKISIANEIAINTTASTIEVVDIGNTIGELTIDEFNISSTELFSCADIDSKDNILFAANITKSDFIVDDTWDARAVRFISEVDSQAAYAIPSHAWLGDSVVGDAVAITVPVGDTPAQWDTAGWDDYVISHDGINIFNDSDNDGVQGAQYKYQSDGTTLGAEGPNIKIDFDTESVSLDISNSDTTFYSAPIVDGDDISFGNYASPWKDGKLSWQRDEIYRLYVVFGNARGQTSDPKWICDLRMPSFHDSGYINSDTDLIYSNWLATEVPLTSEIVTKRLYPRVCFKSLPNNATWAQIYRVKRDRTDKSVVTQGLAVPSKIDGSIFQVTEVNNVLLAADAEIFKLVSPEINITKNITRQSGDYIEYIIDGSTYKYTMDNVSSSGELRYTYKIYDTSDISYSSDIRSDIVDAAMATPLVDQVDSSRVILDGKSYRNYNYIIATTGARGCSGLLISYDNTNWLAEGNSFCIVNYKSKVFGSQYGGYTYEQRSLNSSIPCSDIIYSSNINSYVDISYGDTYINYFDVSTQLYDLTKEDNSDYSLSEVVYVPLESSINTDLLHSTSSQHLTYNTHGSGLRQETMGLQSYKLGAINLEYNQEKDLYLYNQVYSQQLDVRYAIALSIDKIYETSFDCMIKASNVKSNGESSDSWSKFGVNNFIEVDSKYGPINGLHTFNNNLYYWQNKGFGLVSVNERSLINDNSSAQLVLGTGGVLDRYDYISDYVGCKDKFSIVSSPFGIYWFDRMSKSLYRFSKGLDNISKSKYIQSYMTTELVPMSDFKALSHSDRHNDEILFTFFKENATNGFTISFNEVVDAFVSFYDFVPTIYIPYQHRYLTTTLSGFCGASFNRDRLYLHDSDIWDRCYFYAMTTSTTAKYKDSTLEILFNPEYLNTKVFDNMFYTSNTFQKTTGTEIFADTFDHVQCYNDYQNTSSIALTPGDTIQRRERGWTLVVPRNIVNANVSTNPNITTAVNAAQTFKERMRDNYLIALFTYHNDGLYDRFVVSNMGLKYRVSYR